MARTKQTKKRSDDKGELPTRKAREPSKWGTAAKGAFHRPPKLPARTDDQSGNVSYLGTVCYLL